MRQTLAASGIDVDEPLSFRHLSQQPARSQLRTLTLGAERERGRSCGPKCVARDAATAVAPACKAKTADILRLDYVG